MGLAMSLDGVATEVSFEQIFVSLCLCFFRNPHTWFVIS